MCYNKKSLSDNDKDGERFSCISHQYVNSNDMMGILKLGAIVFYAYSLIFEYDNVKALVRNDF